MHSALSLHATHARLRRGLAALLIVCFGLSAAGLAAASGVETTRAAEKSKSAPASEKSESAHWCAPELRALNADVCFYSPEDSPTKRASATRKARRTEQGSATRKAPRRTEQAWATRKAPRRTNETLVIFLHSLIGAQPGGAWELQRRMALMARSYGFSMLVPRGRPGLGPTRDASVLAWPTAPKLFEQYEEELLKEWRDARAKVEARYGAYKRVLIFGFSNGAYYATSLALRENLKVDGVAVFAGGSGSKFNRVMAGRASVRLPIFVGYGSLDAAHKDQRSLVHLLKLLNWPHRALVSHAGHTVTDAQVRGALRFLGHPRGAI